MANRIVVARQGRLHPSVAPATADRKHPTCGTRMPSNDRNALDKPEGEQLMPHPLIAKLDGPTMQRVRDDLYFYLLGELV